MFSCFSDLSGRAEVVLVVVGVSILSAKDPGRSLVTVPSVG